MMTEDKSKGRKITMMYDENKTKKGNSRMEYRIERKNRRKNKKELKKEEKKELINE